jgi:hypothetical protein
MNEQENFLKEFGATIDTGQRLDLSTRNKIQFALMQSMLGDKQDDEEMQLAWVKRHRGAISQILDNPDNSEIRSLIAKINEEALKSGLRTTPDSYKEVLPLLRDHPAMDAKEKPANDLDQAA